MFKSTCFFFRQMYRRSLLELATNYLSVIIFKVNIAITFVTMIRLSNMVDPDQTLPTVGSREVH